MLSKSPIPLNPIKQVQVMREGEVEAEDTAVVLQGRVDARGGEAVVATRHSWFLLLLSRFCF